LQCDPRRQRRGRIEVTCGARWRMAVIRGGNAAAELKLEWAQGALLVEVQ
jgi:hypothetical protein